MDYYTVLIHKLSGLSLTDKVSGWDKLTGKPQCVMLPLSLSSSVEAKRREASPPGQSIKQALVSSCLAPFLTCAIGAYLYDRQGAERDANKLLTLVANLDLPDL
jgi:hypothetical protein